MLGRWKTRFTLRGMIGLITALGILFAMARHYLVPWQSDQSAASALSKVNAQIFMEPRGQYFFRQFAGEKLSQRAIYVHLPDPRVNDETLKIVSRLPYTELLTIRSSHVTDAGLRHLEQKHNLAELVLVDTEVTQAGLDRLRTRLPSLRRIENRKSSL